jgi:hypothetical protein
MVQNKKLLHSRKARVLLLILGSVLIAISPVLFTVGWQERQDALSATRGEIKPAYTIDQSKSVYVELGGLGNDFNMTELANGIDLTRLFHVQQGNQTFSNFPIQITFVDNRLSISAEIRNSDNATVARIADNNWATTHPDNLLIWDRNYNSYAFEVIDQDKIPILQVLLAGQNRILIGCNLLPQGIAAFFILNRGFSFFSDGKVPQDVIQNLRSSTIFNYPSKEHLGEMTNNTSSILSNPLSDSNWIIASSIVLAVIGTISISGVGAETYIIQKEKNTGRPKREKRKPEARTISRLSAFGSTWKTQFST